MIQGLKIPTNSNFMTTCLVRTRGKTNLIRFAETCDTYCKYIPGAVVTIWAALDDFCLIIYVVQPLLIQKN